MGHDLFQGFAVVVPFEFAGDAEFDPFLVEVGFCIGFGKKQQIFASFNRGIEQEIAKRGECIESVEF